MFSIIVPVYNVATYLRDCLESVLGQTFEGWECICVDDGSTDGSGAILDEYTARDVRFKVVHQPNGGVSSARNVGMELATGDWLTFLDGDDMYAARWLETAKKLIDETRPDLLRMGRTMFKGVPPKTIDERFEYSVLDDAKSIGDWGWNTLVDNGFAWELFQRREDALRYKFPVGVTLSEDELRSLRILKDVQRVCVSGYPGYLYRGRKGSAVSRVLRSEERLRFLDEYETLAPDADYRSVYAQQLWECVTGWIRRHEKGDWKNRNLIKQKFLHIVDDAGITARDMKLQWRVPYLLYKHFGFVAPIFITRWLLKALVIVSPCLAKDRNA